MERTVKTTQNENGKKHTQMSLPLRLLDTRPGIFSPLLPSTVSFLGDDL